jgi:hypothetical protein
VKILPEILPGRPVHYLATVLGILCIINLGFFLFSLNERAVLNDNGLLLDIATSGLGLTDLCVATEARYTRHPSVSDRVSPFMDHPGAIEHFPTGSFWAPPPLIDMQNR